MTRLKLGALPDDKPVKITLDMPAEVHRKLLAYAEALEKETGQRVSEPTRLVPIMLDRFMASDRAFRRTVRNS